MRQKVSIKESDLHKLIAESIKNTLNEIGDTPAGQFMLGRLAQRKGEPVDAKTRMRKDKEQYPIFNYADKAQNKADMYDGDYKFGKHYQRDLEGLSSELSNAGIDPTSPEAGNTKEKDLERTNADGVKTGSAAAIHTVEDAMRNMRDYLNPKGNPDPYFNHPDKVDTRYRFGDEDPVKIPFDVTTQRYFGPNSKANIASGAKHVAKSEPATAEALKESELKKIVAESVKKVLKEQVDSETALKALSMLGIVLVDVEGGRMWLSQENGKYYWEVSEALSELDLSYLDGKYTYIQM